MTVRRNSPSWMGCGAEQGRNERERSGDSVRCLREGWEHEETLTSGGEEWEAGGGQGRVTTDVVHKSLGVVVEILSLARSRAKKGTPRSEQRLSQVAELETEWIPQKNA